MQGKRLTKLYVTLILMIFGLAYLHMKDYVWRQPFSNKQVKLDCLISDALVNLVDNGTIKRGVKLTIELTLDTVANNNPPGIHRVLEM